MTSIQPRDLHYFDYLPVAQEAGITEEQLTAIERGTRAEYGSDDLLFELRMLRTCTAIRDRHVTVVEVLKELSSNEASAA